MKFFRKLLFWQPENSVQQIENIEDIVQKNDLLEIPNVYSFDGKQRERTVLDTYTHKSGIRVVLASEKVIE